MHINIYHLLKFFLKENLKIGIEGNRKINSIFWNFKDQKKWKNKEKTQNI
jgi:hypothetical protein